MNYHIKFVNNDLNTMRHLLCTNTTHLNARGIELHVPRYEFISNFSKLHWYEKHWIIQQTSHYIKVTSTKVRFSSLKNSCSLYNIKILLFSPFPCLGSWNYIQLLATKMFILTNSISMWIKILLRLYFTMIHPRTRTYMVKNEIDWKLKVQCSQLFQCITRVLQKQEPFFYRVQQF